MNPTSGLDKHDTMVNMTIETNEHRPGETSQGLWHCDTCDAPRRYLFTTGACAVCGSEVREV